MIRYVPWNGWRILFRIGSQVQAASSSATAAVGLSPSPCSDKEESSSADSPPIVITRSDQQAHETSTLEPKPKDAVKERKSKMVAAAFASLKSVESHPKTRHALLDESIDAAGSVESLLSIAEDQRVSRRHALRIVSQLSDWTNSGRAKLADFEADVRFVKLCRLLGRGLPLGSQTSEKEAAEFGDLAVVLGITGDDEAAKLVAGVSLNQMIRIMSALAQKQRRSTPLLRSLALNIARQKEKLNIKHCADLLYAMAVLNFPHDILLQKTCDDLCECIVSNEKPAVVGSIITSLGLLRYKNTEVLDILAKWVADHITVCRPHDLTALLLTLASVFHMPGNADHLFDVLLPYLTVQDVQSPSVWLDIVWSLVVLDRATPQLIASVLDPEFHVKWTVNTDKNQYVDVAPKLKLLNINAAAQLTVVGYEGPLLLPDSDVHNVPLVRSREKQLLVASILDSFSNFLPSATYLRSNINTGMGFLLDGECMLDSKCNPLPVSGEVTKPVKVDSQRKSTTSVDRKSVGTSQGPTSQRTARTAQKGTRIGILVWDYRDMCRGSPEPNGVAVLCMKLLEQAGYKVLSIPHTMYNPRDKLVHRVQYLNHHLKSLVNSS